MTKPSGCTLIPDDGTGSGLPYLEFGTRVQVLGQTKDQLKVKVLTGTNAQRVGLVMKENVGPKP